MEELWRRGYRYDFRKMKKMEWVPIVVRKEFLYATMDALGWDRERIFDMGVNAPKVSFIMKHFFGLFLNMRRDFEYAPSMWREHYSTGEPIFAYFREKEGSLTLKNFKVFPFFASTCEDTSRE